jgi:hypothetical protein
MMKRRPGLYGAIALAIGALCGPAAALACSCLEPPPPRQALEQSTSVFTGRVTEIRPVQGRGGLAVHRVTLEVTSSWKGVRRRKAVVVTADNSAACGYPFEKGAEYLVYAKKFPGHGLSTNLCTRTARLDEAKDDLRELRRGRSPLPLPKEVKE